MKQLGIMPLLVLAFITRPAVAQDHQGTRPKEAKTFRGVPFNATFDQAKVILQQPNQCTASVSGQVEECPVEMGGDGRGVRGNGRIEHPTLTSNLLLDGTSHVKTEFFFDDYGKTLTVIRLSFSHDDWTTVKALLIEKYGQPVVSHKTLKNLLGASFDGEVLLWTGSDFGLVLQEYNNDRRVGSGVITTLRKKERKESH